MTQQPARFDTDKRRASAKRTAWLAAAFAVAIFVLFFLKQGIWH